MIKKIIKHTIRNQLESTVVRRILAKPATFARKNAITKGIIAKLNLMSNPWTHSIKGDEFLDLRQVYSFDFLTILKGAPRSSVGLVAISIDPVVGAFDTACKTLGIQGIHFDPTHSDFINKVKSSGCDILLCRPAHGTAHIRLMFKEKIQAVSDLTGVRVYPSLLEQRIYEAKRELAYFLQANDVPHPKTNIFYNRDEAIEFVEKCNYPQVFKTHNGAGSSGVEILYTKKQAKRLISCIFDKYYINKSLSDYRDIDYGYLIFQEFVKNAREHRIIKIGDSWFGHEKAKLENQEFMSGSGINKWTPPSHRLLDFCEILALKFNFNTMCFDIFEDEKGNLLVNELQTWFGSYNPSQMYIDNIPGRYTKKEDKWCFESGLFNDNQSLTLRLISALNDIEFKQ